MGLVTLHDVSIAFAEQSARAQADAQTVAFFSILGVVVLLGFFVCLLVRE